MHIVLLSKKEMELIKEWELVHNFERGSNIDDITLREKLFGEDNDK
jgi:hypothetical protein